MDVVCSMHGRPRLMDLLIDYDEVRLCLRTAATNMPTVHPSGDI
jgi:hypothetical protein